MTILKYRPNKPDQDAYKLTMNYDQIMVISKLLNHVRLGLTGEFSKAAFELINAIETCDPSMLDEASKWVALTVSIDDINGEEHPVHMRYGDDPIFDLELQPPGFGNHDDPSFDDDPTVGEFIVQ
jgi:hypothetical protein